jgi:hypothetical protein
MAGKNSEASERTKMGLVLVVHDDDDDDDDDDEDDNDDDDDDHILREGYILGSMRR